MRPFVVAGKMIPGLDSLIQKSVGVGFPEAIQSRDAGAPSATFWSVGSTKNIGGAVNKNLKIRNKFKNILKPNVPYKPFFENRPHVILFLLLF